MPTIRTLPRRAHLAARALDRLARTTTVDEPEAAHLRGFVPRGATCVDVGAEYGLYTLVLAALAGPTGRVFAFEPQPGPYRFVHRCVRGLGLSDVASVAPVALGERRGQAEMSLPRRRGLPVHGRAFVTEGATGLGSNAEFRDERRLRVPTATLDQMMDQAAIDRLDLIKVDVEGFEPAVLRGAAGVLARFRPTLLIEIEDRHLDRFGTTGQGLADQLIGEGYTMAVLDAHGWTEVRHVTQHVRNYLFTA